MNIPKLFFSDKTGQLFHNCVFCDDDLKANEQAYVIEKAFKFNIESQKNELVFEYALCFECTNRLSSEMSKESRKNIQNYIEQNRNEFNLPKDIDNVIEKRLSSCLITGELIAESFEFQIAGFFIKDKLILSDVFPYAIGETAIEEIQKLVSEKTRDFSDKFKNTILPPEINEKIPKNRIVIF